MKKEKRTVNVVIADDSLAVRERLIALLAELDWTEVVAEAADAEEALTAVMQNKPDVMILDLRMPAGSGFRVLNELSNYSRPPLVIVLTNYNYSQYREKAAKAGASFFLDKTTQFSQITALFKRLAGNERFRPHTTEPLE